MAATTTLISDFVKIIESNIRNLIERLGKDMILLGYSFARYNSIKQLFIDIGRYILRHINEFVVIFMGFITVLMTPYIKNFTGGI